MATLAEIEAAIAKAEKAGRPDLADKLRAHAKAMQPAEKYTPEQITAAADKFRANGQADKADRLMAFLPKPEATPKTATNLQTPDFQAPPRAEAGGAGHKLATDFAGFEMFNPELAGRYTPETMPKPGEVVVGQGGGGKSGGARMTVRDWKKRGKPDDTFGETAVAMMEGPIAAGKAFGGGLIGGPSPSRAALAADPFIGKLPGAVLTGLGGVGDAAGAVLSGVGTGLSGIVGLGTEFVPGQNTADESKLGPELLGMSQFAVPELAGASSVASRAATVARPGAKVAPEVIKSAPLESVAAPVAKAMTDTPEAIGALIQRASKGGMGAAKAHEELAAAARFNPDAKAAADRLGIDLPSDVFSDNEIIKSAAGLTRSEVGKEPEALWRNAVKIARDKADEIMAAMDGSPDIASVSEAVKSSLQSTHAALKKNAANLYSAVDASVPKSAPAPVSNIVKALNGVIESIGGVDGLKAAERGLYNLVTGQEKITYGRLLREKEPIGRAIARGDGPYGDIGQADLKRMYAAISDDLADAVKQIGSSDMIAKLKEANQLYAKQKGLEKRITTAYGSDLDGSIVQKLRGAVKQASQGDSAGLTRMLKVIPTDLRKQVVATAISAATRSARATEPGFGLPEFAKFFAGIKANKPIHAQIGAAVGPEAMAMLEDLATVSRRIVSADSNVLRTGKANQVLAGALAAENLVGRVLHSTGGQRVVQAAAGGAGALAAGPYGAMVAAPLAVAMTAAKKDTLALAGKMFSSDAFMKLASDAVQKGVTTPAAMAAVEKSPAFRAWAKAAGINDPSSWLKDVMALAPIAAQEAANSGGNPEYEALRGRYK
jgi:hypothetical protein